MSHEKGAVNTERLDAKAVPFILGHGYEWDDVVGKIFEYSIEGGKGYAAAKISRSPSGDQLIKDMDDEIRTEISVGYRIDEMKLVGTKGDTDEYLVTKWTPYEISSVGIPADFKVGVGRKEKEKHTAVVIRSIEQRAGVINTKMAEATTDKPKTEPSGIEVSEEQRKQIVDGEKTRAREIIKLGERFGCSEESMKFLDNGGSVADFRAWVLDNKCQKGPAIRQIDSLWGTKPKERAQYNICKAILEGAQHLSGFEKEMHQEIGKKTGREATGFFVPEFAFMPQRRDLSAGTPSAGGDLIMTEVEPSLIPYLRHKMVCGRAGAMMLGGLTDNIALPRQVSAATASWVGENVATTDTTQSFDQVGLSPNRLTGATAFSKQLLQQSVVDVQTVVRDDLLRIIALAQDLAALTGNGSGAVPTGILSTPASGGATAYDNVSTPVTFASGYPTWTNVVQFEGNVELSDVSLDESASYVVTPDTKTLWKTIAKSDPRATNQFYPSFIWEDAPGGGPDGRVNGYKAFSTNQLSGSLPSPASGATSSSSKPVIFGKFSDLIIATWGGLDLLTDPYSLSLNFQIRVVINLLSDIALRYGPAFTYSTNSGLA
ncbi:MAG: phage major capsid protein [Terriglobales bacterium]